MKAKPTSSPAVSPARTSASPVEAPDLPEPVQDCGGNWCEPFAWYDPGSRSWRTWQTSLLGLMNNQAGGWAEYSETWPRAGLMLNGIAYRRQSSAPLTSVTAYGLLPTPIANDAEKRGDFNIDRSKCLPGELRRGPLPMLPTPTPTTSAGGPEPDGRTRRKLSTVLARGNIPGLLPTPKASDADKGGRGDLLTVLRGYESKHAGTLLTPTARDWRSGMASEETHGKNFAAAQRNADEDGWQQIWPDEPALQGVDDGPADWVDGVRATGNCNPPIIPETIARTVIGAEHACLKSASGTLNTNGESK